MDSKNSSQNDLMLKLLGSIRQNQEPKPEENNFLPQAILALAPILVGAAIGGARGGAVGGEAGLSGLKTLELSKERERERQKELQLGQSKMLESALKLSAEERAQKAATRAEERQTRELALKEKELGLKEGQEKKIPSSEYAAGTYTRLMEQAEDVFTQLEKSGFDRASMSKSAQSLLPEALKSSVIKAQRQAERSFINSLLRRQSGAAISQSEFQNYEAQFLPRAGDSTEVKEQKRANRLQAIEGMRAEAGKALEKIPYVPVNLNSKQKQEMIPSAQAAPAMPDFNKMSDEELKKFLGR